MYIVGPLFASSLLNRLHIMMTAMIILTVFTLITIFIVLKRLRTSTQKTPLSNTKDTHINNHNSSTEDDNDKPALPLSSKNCYTTLEHHDDEANDCLLIKRTSIQNSNGDIQNQSLQYDTSSTNGLCLSDEQNQTLK